MDQQKRQELYDDLIARYSNFLTSVLWRLSGNREIFEEAIQNAYMGIWRNVEKLENDRAGSYIYRIAMTANAAAWRHRIGRDRVRGGDDTMTPPRNEEAEIERVNTMLEQIRRAIAKLGRKQGRAIILRYFEEKPYPEIAEILGCSEAGARSHVSKALGALKAKFTVSRTRLNILCLSWL